MALRCKLCGKEFKDKRSIHGHLIRVHEEEYLRSGNNDGVFFEEVKENGEERPAGFRLLNKHDPIECEAIAAGYMFYDGSLTVYTEEEAREMGWI